MKSSIVKAEATRLSGQARGHTAPLRQMSFLSRAITSPSFTQEVLVATPKLEGSIQMCAENARNKAGVKLWSCCSARRMPHCHLPHALALVLGTDPFHTAAKGASLALANRGNYGNKCLIRTTLLFLPPVTGCEHARDRKY